MKTAHARKSYHEVDDYNALDDESKCARLAEKINGYWEKFGIEAHARAVSRIYRHETPFGVFNRELWVIKSNLTGRERV